MSNEETLRFQKARIEALERELQRQKDICSLMGVQTVEVPSKRSYVERKPLDRYPKCNEPLQQNLITG